MGFLYSLCASLFVVLCYLVSPLLDGLVFLATGSWRAVHVGVLRVLRLLKGRN